MVASVGGGIDADSRQTQHGLSKIGERRIPETVGNEKIVRLRADQH
jgi:hypothetical protein